MKMRFTISATEHIHAPAASVYAVISDYRDGHPRILPKQLRNLRVVSGGVGAGTVVTFEGRALGRTQQFRAIVSEPEPGRVLVETNIEPAPSVTTFIVNPAPGGADVTISTEFETTRGGVAGLLERFVIERVVPGMYRQELRNLAAVATAHAYPES